MIEIITGNLRIAIVDDVAIQAEYLKSMVNTYVSPGIEVVAFTDPNEALEEIKQGKFFAVFTDIHMDAMMGDDLVRAVNKMNLGVQTYVLTGDDGFITALNCFRLGCRNIFVKPPKNKKIQAAIQNIENDFQQWLSLIHI